MIAGSFRVFASSLIDYAGLFPPAELPLDAAIRNYARYRREPDSWMLGRFLCPATRLEELAPYRDSILQGEEPFRFSALARGGKDGGAFVAGLGRDLQAVAHFRERHPHRIEVEMIEAKLPEGLIARPDAGALIELFDGAADQFEATPLPSLQVFYEASFAGDWRASISWIVDAIGAHASPSSGFKLRCGGLTAESIPSVDQVAYAIAACRDAGIRMKATAGMHHPFRRLDPALGAKAHGFVNLFGAILLAWAHDLDEEAIAAILADEDPAHFRFGETGFAWEERTVPAEEIPSLRTGAAVSFGSCSFDEPREGLRSLGLLPAAAEEPRS